jgi:hypothetical protein
VLSEEKKWKLQYLFLKAEFHNGWTEIKKYCWSRLKKQRERSFIQKKRFFKQPVLMKARIFLF